MNWTVLAPVGLCLVACGLALWSWHRSRLVDVAARNFSRGYDAGFRDGARVATSALEVTPAYKLGFSAGVQTSLNPKPAKGKHP